MTFSTLISILRDLEDSAEALSYNPSQNEANLLSVRLSDLRRTLQAGGLVVFPEEAP